MSKLYYGPARTGPSPTQALNLLRTQAELSRPEPLRRPGPGGGEPDGPRPQPGAPVPQPRARRASHRRR